MILVVALNPALDITHHVDAVDWAGVNRPAAVHVSPGGKGLNVARILHTLGADVQLVVLAGGIAGNVLARALSSSNIPAVFAQTAGETRRTFAVVDTQRGETAIFNEPGPVVTAAEYSELLDIYTAMLARCSAVVLTGSLPPGLSTGTYAGLIAMATGAGVPALLDTSGDALLAGVTAGPAIVKPNLAELEAAVGRPLCHAGEPAVVAAGLPAAAVGLTAVADAAGELRDRGAEAVVVTLGAAGLLAVTAYGTWLAAAPTVSGNPTGAGDAVAAALAQGLVSGCSWAERLSHAAALGAAAVTAPVAGQFLQADYDRARGDVHVSSWERS